MIKELTDTLTQVETERSLRNIERILISNVKFSLINSNIIMKARPVITEVFNT